MTLLRESFAAVNARFHLVGFYTLSWLLLILVADLSGRQPPDDSASDLAVVLVLVLFCLTYCGLHGLVYHAAAGRPPGPVFLRYAAALPLPFFWVLFKVFALVGLPASAALAAYMQLAAPGTPPDRQLIGFVFWTAPVFGLAAEILTLYALPLAIVWRERGAPRTQIREGLRLWRERAGDSLRLTVLLVLWVAMEGALHYTRGLEVKPIAPDAPEALVLFATCYLKLVAFYGASRVVLARFDPETRRDLLEDGVPNTPGPPA